MKSAFSLFIAVLVCFALALYLAVNVQEECTAQGGKIVHNGHTTVWLHAGPGQMFMQRKVKCEVAQ